MMEDRILLIDKPAGISSFGVVAKVRGRLKQEFGHKVKVGHTGTLDPFATGLLILLSGKMTKKSNEFLKLDKEYEAELKLGFISSTGDPEGEITINDEAPDFTLDEDCQILSDNGILVYGREQKKDFLRIQMEYLEYIKQLKMYLKKGNIKS